MLRNTYLNAKPILVNFQNNNIETLEGQLIQEDGHYKKFFETTYQYSIPSIPDSDKVPEDSLKLHKMRRNSDKIINQSSSL